VILGPVPAARNAHLEGNLQNPKTPGLREEEETRASPEEINRQQKGRRDPKGLLAERNTWMFENRSA